MCESILILLGILTIINYFSKSGNSNNLFGSCNDVTSVIGMDEFLSEDDEYLDYDDEYLSYDDNTWD